MLAASKELEASDKGAPQLIVFASLSMPEQSLKQLIRDTAKAGGTVVFNGFPGNSMKAFQQGIMKVVDNQDASGSIDRKSVVKGKSVSVSVDLGGRRLLKQKIKAK